LVVVLGIGNGLFPECVRLLQAGRSAIHAALQIRRVRPDCIFDDYGAGVVNIGQGGRAKTRRPQPGADRLRPSVPTISILGT
jgi:hypothetical protein